jgi:hypothetical protein
MQNEVTNAGMIHGWIQDHARHLVATYCQDINDFGLWVITKTYVTNRVAVAVKYAHSSGHLAGILADAATLAVLDLPGASWSGQMRQSCHIHHSKPGQKVVIFLKGVRYTRMWRLMTGELRRDRNPEKGRLSSSRNIFQKKGRPASKNPYAKSDPATSSDSDGSLQIARELHTTTIEGIDGHKYGIEYEIWGGGPDVHKMEGEQKEPLQASSVAESHGSSYNTSNWSYSTPLQSKKLEWLLESQCNVPNKYGLLQWI